MSLKQCAPFKQYAVFGLLLVAFFAGVTSALAHSDLAKSDMAKSDVTKSDVTKSGLASSDLINDKTILEKSLMLLDSDRAKRSTALSWLEASQTKSVIPALIDVLRFAGQDRTAFLAALRTLSGADAGSSWHEWMLWQQEHREIPPFKGYDVFKAKIMTIVDPKFVVFLYPGVRHDIRLEEIAWGGVIKDGIPALTNPRLLSPQTATYLTDEELVFGVKINGDARAYPLRIMDWHEMFNDVIGGVPVSLAYCTLCGSGILYETLVKGRTKPLIFGSSGFLYRSNKLMYDKETNSLWDQFAGKPVVGTLTGSNIHLKTRPVVITSWKKWRELNPQTKVLSLETGYQRDYTPGQPYNDYFSSPNLMFPAVVDERKLRAKDYVFALRGSSHEKAWPLSLFKTKRVINDTAGILPLTLIGNAATRSVRAYRTTGQAFKAGKTDQEINHDGRVWQVTEEALVSDTGKKLHRLPGHIAYWFAWSGNFGATGDLGTLED